MATDEQTRLELRSCGLSAAWSEHLRSRTDVQNIDLMNLARLLPQLPLQLDEGCRRRKEGVAMSKDASREIRLRHAVRPMAREVSKRNLRRRRKTPSKKQAKALTALRPPTDRCAVLWMSAHVA